MIQSKMRKLLGGAMLLAAGFSSYLHAEQAAQTFTQPRLDAFAAAMAQEVEQGRIGGIATLVYENGEVVQRAEYGFADLEQQRPLEPDSLYKIFSLTKQNPFQNAVLSPFAQQEAPIRTTSSIQVGSILHSATRPRFP